MSEVFLQMEKSFLNFSPVEPPTVLYLAHWHFCPQLNPFCCQLEFTEMNLWQLDDQVNLTVDLVARAQVHIFELVGLFTRPCSLRITGAWMLQSRASQNPGTPAIPTVPGWPTTPGKPRGPRGPSMPPLGSAGLPGEPAERKHVKTDLQKVKQWPENLSGKFRD